MAVTGFNIVFGGTEFHPWDFLQGSQLKWHVVHQGTALSDGRVADESWVEIVDYHPEEYLLNMVWEALDLLIAERDEFLRLSKFPGVTWGTINFYGNIKEHMFDFEAEHIAVLHELGLSVSIYVDVTPEPKA